MTYCVRERGERGVAKAVSATVASRGGMEEAAGKDDCAQME